MTAVAHTLKTTAACIKFLFPTQDMRDMKSLALGAMLRKTALDIMLPIAMRKHALDKLAKHCSLNLANKRLVSLTFDALFSAANNHDLFDMASTWIDILRGNERLGYGNGHFERCCRNALKKRPHAHLLIHPR